jgi:dTDP-4-dehydrorhamnose reductase
MFTYLILGPNGMMGSMFSFYCKHIGERVIDINRSLFDVMKSNLDDLLLYTEGHKNIVVLNFIGCIPQRQYTDEEYYKINEEFPHKLSQFCKKNNFHFIHLSTNCVFSGKKNCYIEIDQGDGEDLYSVTKYRGEPKYGTTIRASIIGLELKNSNGNGLLEWFLRQNNKIYGYLDQVWNGVTTLELSKFILGLDKFEDKIIHVYSRDSLSKYELLLLAKEIFNKEIEIEPINCVKKFYTLSSLYTTPRKTIKEQLEEMYKIKNYYLKQKAWINGG